MFIQIISSKNNKLRCTIFGHIYTLNVTLSIVYVCMKFSPESQFYPTIEYASSVNVFLCVFNLILDAMRSGAQRGGRVVAIHLRDGGAGGAVQLDDVDSGAGGRDHLPDG